ncbi:MAG: sodium:solute symporter family protein [Endomicrobia bacterium]|nr:sodium:solute symporter family protein [Endomicrobiia bacterium]MDW8055730.1 sodium:solute symporter family protein [Elusimicrobiota bacterium]
MNTFDIVTVGVLGPYLLSMLFIGWLSSKKVKDTTDFLVAGRRLGFLFATATMFATWFGSESVMGTAGTVYRVGLRGVIADPFGASFVLILAGVSYAVAFRRMNFLTVTDLFGKFYSKETEIFASLLMMPVYIGWLGAQIVATGLLFYTFTGISPDIGMLLGTAVVLIYTLSGGMWAVTITDFIQMIILIAGIIVILPFVIQNCGGINNVINNTPKEFLTIFPQEWNFNTLSTFLGKWFIIGLGCAVGQDLIQRSLSSKTEQVARWSAITAGIIYFIIGCIVIFIGLAARIMMPGLENSENLIPILANKYLGNVHPFLFALFISGLLAAIMSSADSSLLAAVSIFCNNIFQKVYPNVAAVNLLLVNRITTVVVVILSMLIALHVKQIYNLMVNSWSTLLVSIFVPSTVALFMKKFTSVTACWVSMVSGFIVWAGYIIFKTGKFIICDETIDVFYQASFLGFLSSVVGYFCTFLVAKLLSQNTSQT